MIIFIFLLASCQLAHPKSVSELFAIPRMVRQNNFMYLGRMDFGLGNSTAEFKIKMVGKHKMNEAIPAYWLGLLMDEQFDQFSNTNDCAAKAALLKQQHRLLLENGEIETKFEINQNIRQHIWYYYLYTCDPRIIEQKSNYDLRFYVNIISLNGGSHFGEDEGLLWGYVLAFVFSIFLLPLNIKKFIRDYQEREYDYAHMAITLAILLLAISYMFKLFHLWYYHHDGFGIVFFDVMFLVSRTLSESIVYILLSVIAWGWTITYIGMGSNEIIMPLGVICGVVNITTIAVGKVFDDSEFKNHHFDCVPGYISLWFRTLMLIMFCVGIWNTLQSCRAKTRKFVKQFAFLGVIYVGMNPVATIICELFLPNYLQNQTIILLTEVSHAIANSLLTYMITSNKSQYTQLQYHPRSFLSSRMDGKVLD